jgi:hypothetical protein
VKPFRIVAPLFALALQVACQSGAYGPSPRMPMPGTQRAYDCLYLSGAEEKPAFEGPEAEKGLDQEVWAKAPWMEPFVDIEGPSRPAPRLRTWVKMLWDDEYLYIGALLEEPDVWATYAKRDMVVYHENDFEAFIDPIGEGDRYYEIEVNAKGTIFDLYMHKPYRAGGPAMPQWNCEGIDGLVRVQGTLNDGSDRDRSWSIEMRVPWKCLRPPVDAPAGAASEERSPEAQAGARPAHGDTWRMNFSRVEWQVEWKGGAYEKVPGTREDNWVWTPQWAVDMHRPEHWGRVHFVGWGR